MVTVETAEDMMQLGTRVGSVLRGGEIFELIGDVGAGKTTFVKGMARGLGIDEDVQSPSFTISRVYPARDELTLYHYDFYRLPEPGVMSYELGESLGDTGGITVVEWAETVHDTMPSHRCSVTFRYDKTSDSRHLTFVVPDEHGYLKEELGL